MAPHHDSEGALGLEVRSANRAAVSDEHEVPEDAVNPPTKKATPKEGEQNIHMVCVSYENGALLDFSA